MKKKIDKYDVIIMIICIVGFIAFTAFFYYQDEIKAWYHQYKYGDMDTDITKFYKRADIINAKEAELKELEALRDDKAEEKSELDQQLREDLLINAGINLVD